MVQVPLLLIMIYQASYRPMQRSHSYSMDSCFSSIRHPHSLHSFIPGFFIFIPPVDLLLTTVYYNSY